MDLREYLDKRRTPSPSRWAGEHRDEMQQARAAVIDGEQMTMIYNWLVDHCGYPGGMTTFRRMVNEWKREYARAVAA